MSREDYWDTHHLSSFGIEEVTLIFVRNHGARLVVKRFFLGYMIVDSVRSVKRFFEVCPKECR